MCDMKRLVLLDAHAILHRAYHALPDFSTAKGEPTGALYGLSAMLIKIIEQLKPDYIVACYDVKGPTHRHEAYKEYKAQRKQIDDDLIRQINRSRDIFTAFGIPIYDKQGFEADDILGTIVEQMKGTGDRVQGTEKVKSQKSKVKAESDFVIPAKAGIQSQTNKTESSNTLDSRLHGNDKTNDKDIEIVIASGDMDTLQLVKGETVQVYTLKKGISDTIMYDEKAVRERYGFGPELIPDYKGLRGDPSDNIPGVKGIGDKTATVLITAFGSVESIYRELESGHDKKFEEAGISPRIIQLLKDNKEEADFSKVLATITRNVPIDFRLPDKTFREALDLNKINALWTELEFRTLEQRLKGVIEGKGGVAVTPAKAGVQGETIKPSGQTLDSRLRGNDNKREGDKNRHDDDSNGAANSLFSTPTDSSESKKGLPIQSNVDPGELEKTALALWLVNSNTTDPKLEDILNFANTEDFDQAKKAVFEELDKRTGQESL